MRFSRDLEEARELVDDQDAEALAARVLFDAGLAEAAAIPTAKVIELIAAAAAFGRRYAVARLLCLQTCRACGCTHQDGCPDGEGGACSWACEDLCTACAEESLELTAAGVEALIAHAAEASA